MSIARVNFSVQNLATGLVVEISSYNKKNLSTNEQQNKQHNSKKPIAHSNMNSLIQPFKYQNGPSYQRGHYVPILQVPNTNLIIYAHTSNIFLYDKKQDIINIYRGHKSIVTALDVHPSGYSVISGDKQGNIKIWCPTHETLLTEYETNLTQAINIVQFNSDGQKVLIGLQQGKSVFQILDTKLKTFKSINADGDIQCVCTTNNRPFKYIGCNTEGLASIGNGFGDFEKSFKIVQNIRSICCINHNLNHKAWQLFICGNISGNLSIVNLKDEKTLLSEKVHSKSIINIEYQPHLDAYLSLSNDGSCNIFTMQIQQENDTEINIKLKVKLQLTFFGLPINSLFIKESEQYIIYSNTGFKYVWDGLKQKLLNDNNTNQPITLKPQTETIYAYNKINFMYKCSTNDILAFTDDQIINYSKNTSIQNIIKGDIKLLIEDNDQLLIFTTVGYYKLNSINFVEQNETIIEIDSLYNTLSQIKNVSQVSPDNIAICTSTKVYHFNLETKNLQEVYQLQKTISEFLCMDYSSNYYVIGYKDKVSSQKNGIIILNQNFQQQGDSCKYFSNIAMIKATTNGLIAAGTDGALIYALYEDFTKQKEVWPAVSGMDYSKSTVGQIQHINLIKENIAIIGGHLGLIWWNFQESTQTNKIWGKIYQGLDSKSAIIEEEKVLYGGIDGCIYQAELKT